MSLRLVSFPLDFASVASVNPLKVRWQRLEQMSPEQQCWKRVLHLFYISRSVFNCTLKAWNREQMHLFQDSVSKRVTLGFDSNCQKWVSFRNRNQKPPRIILWGRGLKGDKAIENKFWSKKTILELNHKYVDSHIYLNLQTFSDLPGLGKEVFDLVYPHRYWSLTNHWLQEHTA